MTSLHPFCLSRRRLLAATGLAALAGCSAAPPAAPAIRNPALRLIGETRLPHRLRFQDTVVGGLSGLDYDAARDLWYAISDERSAPRFYTLRLPISSTQVGPPELLGVQHLKPNDRPDPESIRWRAATGTLLWSSEGDVARGQPPALRESATDGRSLRSFTLPPHFGIDAAGQRGPRDNLGFEGLALTPDGTGAWTALENALHQDGPPPRVGAVGGPCRFTLFDLASGQAIAQRAYVPEAIPQAARLPLTYADNGVSEILMLDAQRMLVLERAYMAGVGNALRLYRVDLASGSDTLALPALQPGQFTPLRKTLVADLSAYLGPGLAKLDNTECMAWGPSLPAANGQGPQRTLVLLSDDNFNPMQVTQFVAFAVTDTL